MIRTDRTDTDSASAETRLSVLAHELANLLDGSMRCIAKLRAHAGLPPLPSADPTDAERRLEAVYQAMAQMACLVRDASRPGSGRATASAAAWSVLETIRNAAEVMTPAAEECGIVIEVEAPGELLHVARGPAYPVLAAALRNAIDSIGRACSRPGTRRGGTIRIRARLEPNAVTGRAWAIVEIEDDGEGLPASARRDPGVLLRHGVSRTPDGTGIGLAVARDAVDEAGGVIEIRPRPGPVDPIRPGALVRAAFPAVRRVPAGEG